MDKKHTKSSRTRAPYRGYRGDPLADQAPAAPIPCGEVVLPGGGISPLGLTEADMIETINRQMARNAALGQSVQVLRHELKIMREQCEAADAKIASQGRDLQRFSDAMSRLIRDTANVFHENEVLRNAERRAAYAPLDQTRSHH